MPQKEAIRVAIASLVAVAALMSAWRYSARWAGLDFYQFWAGAQIARARGLDLYSADVRREEAGRYLAVAQNDVRSERKLLVARARPAFEFYSTPFLYASFGIFSGDYERDFFGYRVLLIGSFAVAVLLLCRTVSMPWPRSLLLLAFLLLLFEPFTCDLRVCNVNSLQLLVLSSAIAVGQGSERTWRWVATGALLGLVVAFKPNVVFIAPLLLMYRVATHSTRRLLIESAGAVIGVSAGVVVGASYFGSMTAWTRWLDVVRELSQSQLPLSTGNISLPNLLAPQAATAASLIAAAVLMGLSVIAFWRRRGIGQRTALVIAAGLVIYLMSATLVWMHYLVLAVPLAIVLLGDGLPSIRLGALAAATLVGDRLWRALLGVQTQIGQAMLFWSGLVLLYAIALWRLSTPDPPPRRPVPPQPQKPRRVRRGRTTLLRFDPAAATRLLP